MNAPELFPFTMYLPACLESQPLLAEVIWKRIGDDREFNFLGVTILSPHAVLIDVYQLDTRQIFSISATASTGQELILIGDAIEARKREIATMVYKEEQQQRTKHEIQMIYNRLFT